jgi:hypothetical protein
MTIHALVEPLLCLVAETPPNGEVLERQLQISFVPNLDLLDLCRWCVYFQTIHSGVIWMDAASCGICTVEADRAYVVDVENHAFSIGV